MTVKEYFLKKIQDHGLSEAQAGEVMDRVQVHPVCDSMKDRWHHAVDGYPPQVFTVLWMPVKFVAREWFKEHAPQHWAKPMFD